MTIKKEHLRILIIGAVILLFLGTQNNLPKRAVADVEGLACVDDKDCPCWGQLENKTNVFGIGSSVCREDTKTCDTSLCVDVQPVGEYLKNNPFQWIKDNILTSLLILSLLIGVAMWPRQ